MFLTKPWTVAPALWATLVAVGGSPSAAQEGAAGEAPVVVAIDTSRSLTRREIDLAIDRLGSVLEALPAATPVGLLAFDDEPRWIQRLGGSPSAIAAALRGLELRGNYTLLNDAVFVATRELAAGGVILLATDGRDENSATTVDDIARRCEALNIRIFALGIGEPLAERALRRLALVSNGVYLGPIEAIDAAAVSRAVETARSSLREAARPPRAAPPDPAAPESTTGPAAGPGPPAAEAGAADRQAPPGGTGRWLDNLYLPAVILAALLGFWLWRRSRSEAVAEPEEPEQELDADLQLRLAERPAASLAETPEVTVDTAVFEAPVEGALEKTRVLAEQGVLIVRKSSGDSRLYLLGSDKAFVVGRSREGNTLAVPDPALSSSHFKIVPEDRKYYLLDLGSTNGTFVNGHRMEAKELESGDVLRAGQVEFEFQRQI